MKTKVESKRSADRKVKEIRSWLARWQSVRNMPQDELLEMKEILLEEERERKWLGAGRVIRKYVGTGRFPRNGHLEQNVWYHKLRGIVADNLRKGYSPLGDD